jgi:hypothetical protein
MSAAPEGLATLASVRQFLLRLVPEVRDELSGEVRAAVKLLDTAEIELNERHRSLTVETQALLDHCRSMAELVGRRDVADRRESLLGRLKPGQLTLAELEALGRETGELTSSLIGELQAVESAGESAPESDESARRAARDALRDVYACLGRHARARLSWQSVFAPSRLGSSSTESTSDRKDLR